MPGYTDQLTSKNNDKTKTILSYTKLTIDTVQLTTKKTDMNKFTNLPTDTEELTTKNIDNTKIFYHLPTYQQIPTKLSPRILINQKEFHHLPNYQHIPTNLQSIILIRPKKYIIYQLTNRDRQLTNSKKIINSNIETKNVDQITNVKLPNEIRSSANLLNVVHQLIRLPENSKELFQSSIKVLNCNDHIVNLPEIGTENMINNTGKTTKLPTNNI